MTHIHSGVAAVGVDVPTQDGRDSLPSVSGQSIAGVIIPDTVLVRDVTALIRETEDDLLFDHSRRVFLFGALQGQRRGLQPDLELLYGGAMFHDIGLTARYRNSNLRFEVDGANAARAPPVTTASTRSPLRRCGWASLHTLRECANSSTPGSRWSLRNVETDVLGIGRDELPRNRWTPSPPPPRPDFKPSFRRSPTAMCTAGDHVRQRQRDVLARSAPSSRRLRRHHPQQQLARVGAHSAAAERTARGEASAGLGGQSGQRDGDQTVSVS